MIVKISASEKELTAKLCAEMNCTASFYTIETNNLMVQAVILNTDGSDLSNSDAWYVGRTIAWAVFVKTFCEIIQSN